jgi:hypothetical protein
MRRILLALGASLSILAGGAPAVLAQPSNDDFDNATVVSALPFADEVNTVDATEAADDPWCSGRGPTVWYRYTPAADVRIEANTLGSNYDTTLAAYSGSRGALTEIACNDDWYALQSRVDVSLNAGVTYYFMVGAFGSGYGGNLVFSISEPVPYVDPEVAVVLSDSTVNAKTGVATLSGTITCSGGVSSDSGFHWAYLTAEIKQVVARRTIVASSYAFVSPCRGTHPWSIGGLRPDNGPFVGGTAQVDLYATHCDALGCAYQNVSTTVRLRGTR